MCHGLAETSPPPPPPLAVVPLFSFSSCNDGNSRDRTVEKLLASVINEMSFQEYLMNMLYKLHSVVDLTEGIPKMFLSNIWKMDCTLLLRGEDNGGSSGVKMTATAIITTTATAPTALSSSVLGTVKKDMCDVTEIENLQEALDHCEKTGLTKATFGGLVQA